MFRSIASIGLIVGSGLRAQMAMSLL